MHKLAPIILALALAGCQSGDALIVVTARVNAPLTGVRELKGTIATKSKTGTFSVGDASGIATSTTFALQFPATYAGPVTITVDAVNAAGNVLASGKGSVTAIAGKRVDVTITLGGGGGACDGGSCAVGDMSGVINDLAGADLTGIVGPDLINPCALMCNGICVPSGGCCTVNDCTQPSNGTVACNASNVCVVTCNSGYELASGTCALSAPTLRAPISNSYNSSRQPSFTIWPNAAADDAQIQVCDEPTCAAHAPVTTFLASVGKPAITLPASKILFWRAFSIKGGVQSTLPSATWAFATPAVSAGATTAKGAVRTYFDVNRDGYADLVIGAPGQPAAYIFLGSATGIHTTPDTKIVRPTAAAASTTFGFVADAGDIDGDGYSDVLVSGGANTTNGGNVYVYRGGPGLIGSNPQPIATIAMAPSTQFGGSIAGLGDFNGDGYADFAVAADASNVIYVYRGKAAGATDNEAADYTFQPPASNNFGSVINAGDVNCDGRADLVAGGTNDAIYYVLGADPGKTGATQMVSGPASSSFGLRLAAGLDLNGDGCADVTIGESAFATTHEGFFSLGSTSGLGTASTIADPNSGSDTAFGVSAIGMGPFGGGASASDSYTMVTTTSGNFYVFEGSAMTLRSTVTLSGLTTPFGAAGDLNGDGYGDAFINMYPNGVLILYGNVSGWPTTLNSSSTSPVMTTIPIPSGAQNFGSNINGT